MGGVLMDEAGGRYTLEQDGETFYIRDNVTSERLPYESRDKAFVEGILKRLQKDYERYVTDKGVEEGKP